MGAAAARRRGAGAGLARAPRRWSGAPAREGGRAGGDGGRRLRAECGRRAGRWAPRPPRAPPWGGPGPGPRRSFVPGGPASPVRSAAAPQAPGRFVCARCPPRLCPPAPLFRRLRRSVGAAARPASRLHLPSAVLPPVPLCCSPLLGSRVTCHSPGTRSLPFPFFHCLSRMCLPPPPLTFFCLVLGHPQRLCLPYLVAQSLSIPFLSRHCLLDLSTAYCVC